MTSWLYNDTKGLITVGLGFYIPNEAALSEYRWEPGLSEATADYRRLKDLPKGKVAEWYRPHTHARLSLDSIMEGFDRKATAFIKQLERSGWRFSQQPEPVRRVLFDMCWNLGAGGLEKYVQFKAAVLRGDWAKAAQQCNRRGISLERNNWARTTLLSVSS